MDTAKYTALFLSDSREQLRRCEAVLLDWERHPSGTEPVTELFRALHTLKGMAATMGYTHLAALTHDAEHLLEAVREERVPVGPELVALVLEVVDAIGAGVEDAGAGADGRRLDPALVARLAAASAAATPTEGETPPVQRETASEVGGESPPTQGCWVSLRIRPGAAMPLARALLALQRAESLGRVTAVTPAPAAVNPERFDGRLRFHLASDASEEQIHALLLEVGEIAEVVVDAGLGGLPGHLAGGPDLVRIGRTDLDRLLVEVGELVVARNRLAALAEQAGEPALETVTADLARLIDAVHHRVLAARMVPVADVFDRFPRVVRDLARALGKMVRLDVTGREIELDRSVLEAVGEPLLHLVRNAVDHGLETPAERAAAGKPAEGVLRLEARRDRDAVEIVIADDGRGIDRERVRDRLRREGAERDVGDDAALLQVLARPGFSTAGTVTGVSGRGVGVDTVLARLRSLGGSLTLRSVAGEGTTFVARLPLTLAVVPALLVTAADQRYAIPLARIAETGGAVPQRHGARLVVTFRDEALAATDLRERVGVPGPPPEGRRPFLVVTTPAGRAALLVDQFLGRQDLVVTTVDPPAGAPAWLAGAATLADGVPAFLLDPAGVIGAEAA